MDEGIGVGESRQEGWAGVRLCNLAAQIKVYKSQIPVIDQVIETAALMPGKDKSRGYFLEMICADFLAGAISITMTQRRSCNPCHGSSSSCLANNGRLFCTK